MTAGRVRVPDHGRAPKARPRRPSERFRALESPIKTLQRQYGIIVESVPKSYA